MATTTAASTSTSASAADDFLASVSSSTSSFVSRVVLPGDTVTADVTLATRRARIGKGLAAVGNGTSVVSTCAGMFQHRAPNRFWVQNNQKRYVPVVDDTVVGVVVQTHAENHRISIGASSTATLPALAFDGATRRNKPDLRVGNLVYARLVRADKDLEPELTCMAAPGQKAKDWVTGLSMFGELKGGTVLRVSLGLARRLRSAAVGDTVLDILGQYVPFEVAAGCNGWVWVHSGSAKHTIVVRNAILNSEHLTQDQCHDMVRALVAQLDDVSLKRR